MCQVIVHPMSGVQLRKATPEEIAADHEQINPDNVRHAIKTLVELFGPLGTQNLFDTLGASDTHPLRQVLAEVVQGGRAS